MIFIKTKQNRCKLHKQGIVTNSLFFFVEMCYIISMKNKKRFLSVVLCFLMLFLVGCNNVLEDNGVSVKAFDGVKVLTRPADYFDNIGEIVGDNASENYYNIFAANVLNNLYLVYENMSGSGLLYNYDISNLDTKTLNLKDAQGPEKYYFYDSLRYTISNVDETKDEERNTTEVVLGLNINSWKWTISPFTSVAKAGYFFKNLAKEHDNWVEIIENENKNTIKINVTSVFLQNNSNWTEMYSNGQYLPSFSEFYVGDEIKNDTVTQYFTSPYKDYGQTGSNFFQDALEYATYMFVLGFDYMSKGEDVATTVVPNLFKFAFTETDTEGITGMKVAGWNADGTMNFENAVANISVEDALGFAKEFYKKNGNIV